MSSTLVERMRKVFLDEKTADIFFVVGDPANGTQRRIFAHLNVLKPASEAFEAMFSEKFKDERNIAVPDADPDAFVEMLRYVYTNHANIDVSNAVDILYLSQKYLLPDLSQKIVGRVKLQMSADNVCSFLPYTHIFDDIRDRCWEIVDTETTSVIRSDAFLALDIPHLLEILRRETLAVDEAALFDRVVKWAKRQPKKQPESVSICELLGELLHLIRFELFDVTEKTQQMTSDGVLSAKDAEDFLRWNSTRNAEVFKTTERCHKGRTSNRGRITMWLKNFVDFMEGPAQDVGYQSPLVCGERSRRVWIGGFSWSILAARCESLKKYGPPCFGYFVRCHGDGGNEDWSCDAECTLKIVAHQPEKNKLTMKFTQNFAATSKMKAWGFVSFGEYEDLIKAEKGFLSKDGALELVADISIIEPPKPPSDVADNDREQVEQQNNQEDGNDPQDAQEQLVPQDDREPQMAGNQCSIL